MAKRWLSKHEVDHLHYMTPIENAPLMLLTGILSYNKAMALPHHSVALWAVQRRREAIIPGTRRRMHDYVPLYFATHTPMQYVITFPAPTARDNEVISQHNLVFFEIDAAGVFSIPGMVFTDGNAAAGRTSFFTRASDLDRLDWETIRSPNAYPQCYNWEWKRKKSSEVLVPDRVPPDLFNRVVLFSQQAANDLFQRFASLASNVEAVGASGWRSYLSRFTFEIDQSHYF